MKHRIDGRTIESPREVDAALRGFRSVLGPCGFNALPTSHGYRWELSAGAALPVEVSGRSLLAIPFADGPTFRIAAQCFSRTDPRARQAFAGLTMSVLYQELQSGPVAPLLRVEWEAEDKPSEAKHAQPHWHVYGAGANQVLAPDRLHLALAARWHEADETPIYTQLSEANVARWIAGCLRYTQGQLRNVASRRSA